MKNIKKKNYKIGIDARFYGPLGKGLGRYTQEVVDNIVELDKENEYIIFLCKENYNEFQVNQDNVKKILTNVRWYSLKEQIMLPYYFYKYKLDLIHFTHFNVPIFTPVKFIVTIHDLILTRFPTLRATTLSPIMYKLKNLAYKIVIKHAVKRAKKIITVSNFTKNDILAKFKIKAKKIEVTYEGVAKLTPKREELRDDKNVLSSYNIKEKEYLLYVGNVYPHKNLEWLLETFKDLKKELPELKLVLVGKEDYFYTRLKEKVKKINFQEIQDSIRFLGYVPDQELDLIYKNAQAYIFPSLYEGFGLPPLEAMSRGCPVISSNQASLPEILGEAAFYFNPYDSQVAKNKILKFLQEENFRNSFINKGYEQVKKYSWKKCVKETKSIYLKVLNS